MLERELGGLLFQRKPFVVMTALARAIQPHMQRITEAADQAFQTVETFRAKEDSGNGRLVSAVYGP